MFLHVSVLAQADVKLMQGCSIVQFQALAIRLMQHHFRELPDVYQWTEGAEKGFKGRYVVRRRCSCVY